MQRERTGVEGNHNTGRNFAPGGPGEEGIHTRDGTKNDTTPDSEIQNTATGKEGDSRECNGSELTRRGTREEGTATQTVPGNNATANAEIEETLRKA